MDGNTTEQTKLFFYKNEFAFQENERRPTPGWFDQFC